MSKYMAVYTWNGITMALFDNSYSKLIKLIDGAFNDGIETVQVYTLNSDQVYEHLLSIRELR